MKRIIKSTISLLLVLTFLSQFSFVFALNDIENGDNLKICARSVILDSSFSIRYLIQKDEYDAFVANNGSPNISYMVFKDNIDFSEDETEAILPSSIINVDNLSDVSIGNVDYLSFFVSGIAPKDADNIILITISYNGKILDSYSDSLKEAMNSVVSGSYSSKFSDAARSILEYSQFAALYFGKDSNICESDTEYVGNDKFTDVSRPIINENPIKIVGTSLILKDELSVRFWIDSGNVDMSDVKIFVDSKDVTSSCKIEKNKGNAGYYVLTLPRSVNEMDDPITAYITNKDGVLISNEYTDSVSAYCLYAINNGHLFEKLVPLAKKILNYIYYANIYLDYKNNPTEKFTVTFKDWNGTVLSSQEIEAGGSAIPPSDPVRSGYVFNGWQGTYTNINADTVITATYIEDNKPKIVVNSANASAGATKVTITVSLENNPGFLTMALQTEFDENVLTLTKVSTGIDFIDYSFTGPKSKVSGCKSAWFSTDLPEEIIDGDIMTLQFTVAADAPSGNYPITISCPNDGSTVDGNKTEFTMNNAVGYINVN